MPKYWLVNHSWESFRRTQEYCGFRSPTERDKISVGDKVVYYGNGLVFGVFEVVALVDNKFRGWERAYPYQIKIKPLDIPNNPTRSGILARTLTGKIKLQKSLGGSPNLVELSKEEFYKVVEALRNGIEEI